MSNTRTAEPDPLQVECSDCGAQPEARCTDEQGDVVATHTRRILLADRKDQQRYGALTD